MPFPKLDKPLNFFLVGGIFAHVFLYSIDGIARPEPRPRHSSKSYVRIRQRFYILEALTVKHLNHCITETGRIKFEQFFDRRYFNFVIILPFWSQWNIDKWFLNHIRSSRQVIQSFLKLSYRFFQSIDTLKQITGIAWIENLSVAGFLRPRAGKAIWLKNNPGFCAVVSVHYDRCDGR